MVEVTGETVVVSGSTVTIAYTQQTEYSDNDLLVQLNENIVSGLGLVSALIGCVIGFAAVKELLKIWLQ